ncbi:type I pullulanase [Mycoplasmatota bacterium WC30]
MLKKLILALTLGFFSILVMNITSVEAEEIATDTLIIHYFRYNGDYDEGWNMWLWPSGGSGAGFYFDEIDDTVVTDGYGAVATIDMVEEGLGGATEIGVIMRMNEWERKDVDKDRYMIIPENSENGEVHVYFVEGDERIGYSIDDPNGPDKSNKVISAYFMDVNTITYSLTTAAEVADISLKVNGTLTTPTISITGRTGTLTLPTAVDLGNTYELIVDFDGNIKEYIVTFDGIYDTVEFEDSYYYDGDDLGAIVDGDETSFRIWAPISSSVTLNIYDSGSPAYLIAKDSTATDTPTQTIEMNESFNGTWITTVSENLHGKYYTFSVTNGISTNEVVDPYAKSAGVNGLRGMVVEFSQTNPNGFEYGVRPDNMTNYTDSVIYELHVRDLTTHSSWEVDAQYEEYRGRFMGLTVGGTTYEGIPTGLDHIIDLGVTHVQLLPFFDYGNAVDESGSDTQFNWGYMPLNFNVLEGYYATDPYDGSVRINEFKQVVNSFTENDLRIVMDVVYNHTGQSGDSNFNLILPGYYHRMNADGSFSNGSGTGNETASERVMMQKFMVDSTVFWASEYNISGFRFDLMALHDVETMNMITAALHDIDETIIVYGEPWTGGGSPLDSDIVAGKENLADMPGVAAFNDEIRDGVKGSVFNASEGGFVQNNLNESILTKLKSGIVGGTDYPGIDESLLSYEMAWGNNPSQVINYVSAHDNNTLYDKLKLSTAISQREFVPEMQKQANAIVLLAQGIPFIHAGAEFMRSKPASSGPGFDENSYQSPDSTNQLRWDELAEEENQEIYNYYKEMIAFRLNHPAFRMTTAADVLASLDFIEYEDETVLAYKISSYANGDSFDEILVIHNTGDFVKDELPAGIWNLVGDASGISDEIIKTYEEGDDFVALENETLVFYSGEVVEPAPTDGGCASCDSLSSSIIIFGVITLFSFFIYRRKF